MYKNFFGLRENPFNVNPDPRYLYLTSKTQEALAHLTYGIQRRKGFILLTGEVGTGKTTLINYLLDWLRHHKMSAAFIFNSKLSVNHLFDFILADFGIPVDFQGNNNALMRFHTWLIERSRVGDTPVLIVDEAQGLSAELLEEIRLLLNLETPSQKLLQIVLAGQPELEDKLKRPELRQRIALRCNTAPLTLEESHGYIAERLRIGGAVGDPIFAFDAMDAVHFYSQGIPRIINLLCEHALINAYVENFRLVPARMVEEAARDFLLDEFPLVPARPGLRDHMDCNLPAMYSISKKELVPPFTTEQASLPEPPHKTWPSAPAAFAVKEPALTRESSSLAAVPACVEMLASGENLNVSVSMNNLISALPPLPALQVVPPGGRNQPLPAAKGKLMSAWENRKLTLDTINQLPLNARRISVHTLLLSWKSWSSPWVNRFLLSIFLAKCRRLSLVTFRRIEHSTLPVRAVLWRWMVDFRRDWIAMINTFSLPEMKKSSLRWPRQSISSKPHGLK